ncbi:hypothetical protein AK812_SmicGene29475 [Symbiodinium microadriaticum]|uniref:Uncharacterized protein n=1 Tax=Symbiodinium microadriaticum TaxID=2951 RepID=A0A1Q9D1Q9_SYMMI|nr:hypothetical protein AK812_SmicGene29475 [Symbiodinium microadriaticum]
MVSAFVTVRPQMNLVNLSTAIQSGQNRRVRSMATGAAAEKSFFEHVVWSLATLRIVHRPLLQVISLVCISNMVSPSEKLEIGTEGAREMESTAWRAKTPSFDFNAAELAAIESEGEPGTPQTWFTRRIGDFAEQQATAEFSVAGWYCISSASEYVPTVDDKTDGGSAQPAPTVPAGALPNQPRPRRKSLRGSKGPSTTKADGVMVLLSPEVPANTVRWKEHLKGRLLETRFDWHGARTTVLAVYQHVWSPAKTVQANKQAGICPSSPGLSLFDTGTSLAPVTSRIFYNRICYNWFLVFCGTCDIGSGIGAVGDISVWTVLVVGAGPCRWREKRLDQRRSHASRSLFQSRQKNSDSVGRKEESRVREQRW